MGWKITCFLLLVILFALTANIDTSSAFEITGEATSNVNINITVTVPTPTLTIKKPRNETYLNNHSLKLDIEISNVLNVWYNLDNNENISFTADEISDKKTYFNTTAGSHTINVFANNSANSIAKNTTFFVNLTSYSFSYSEYTGEKKGNSTDFLIYSYEEMQNLSDVVLEHTDYGNIHFNDVINYINILSGTYIDQNTHTNISLNRIEINSTALPNFNVSATLSFYNLNLTNPRITMDGVACPATICTKQSYSAETGTLVFNVTHFTVFSAEETPGETSESSQITGSGSGTGEAITSGTFSVTQQNIDLKIKQGESTSEKITIKNTGETELSFSLTSQKLNNLIKISEQNFNLKPDESKTVSVFFSAKEDIVPDLYIGRIIVAGGETKKEILVSLELESKKTLFDVDIEIPEEYKTITPGENLLVVINLFNIGAPKGVDVFIEYEIRDEQNQIILKETEEVGVETRASLSKSFKIPETTDFGSYVLYIKVLYDSKIASTSEWFDVGKSPFSSYKIVIYLIAGILLISISILIIEIRKIKKELKFHHKIDEHVLAKHGLIKRKIKPETRFAKAFKK